MLQFCAPIVEISIKWTRKCDNNYISSLEMSLNEFYIHNSTHNASDTSTGYKCFLCIIHNMFSILKKTIVDEEISIACKSIHNILFVDVAKVTSKVYKSK